MRRLLYIGVLAGAACGSDSPSGPPAPTAVTLVSGAQQTGPVGVALPQPFVVRVDAGSQAAAGISVQFSSASGGFFSPTSAKTDASGNATTTWTLGPVVGPQTATASVGTLAPVTISATATVGAPTTLFAVAGSTQFAVAGRSVTVRPKVQLGDAFGNVIEGRTITFTVLSGGGSISDSVQVTDAGGHAELGGWTLGPGAGSNKVRAFLDANISVDVVAIGTAAAMVLQSGDAQSANAGTRVAVSPAVLALDGQGAPMPNVTVNFAVESGGGRVLEASQQTDGQGIAHVGAWILGLAPGTNGLAASTPGVPQVHFTAQGLEAVPAAMTASTTTALSGFVGNFLGSTPAVRVTDAGGLPVAGAQVTFDVVTGGGVIASPPEQSLGIGLLTGALAVSDFDGQASLGAWRLGPSVGSQTVQASMTGLPPVVFAASAAALPPAEYHIEIRFIGTPPDAGEQAAFDFAAQRWGQLVLGDVSDELAQFPATSCFPALDETIDDLIIYAELTPIDGAGGILGSAGPCLIRDNGQPAVGHMQFDTADLAQLESAGALNLVILHEMGHVIGIGSMWDFMGLLTGGGTGDPYFTGPTARSAWRVAAATLGFGGNIVPVENVGGPGTADAHWRESVARNELMTGFLNSGPNPLSAITVGSLRDMGYVVNDAASDDFQLLPLLRAGPSQMVQLREVPLEGDIAVIRHGRIVRTVPRKPF